MLRLDTITRSLEITLAGAVTTNQLPVVACYSDQTASSYNGNTQLSNTNNTTPVTIVGAPGASTNRDIDYLSVWNRDTASATVIITLNDNATLYIVASITLAVGEQLTYTHGEGWRSVSASGQLKTVSGGGGGSVALNDLTDVTITSATAWDFFQYTPSNVWENVPYTTYREVTPPGTALADTIRLYAEDRFGRTFLAAIANDGVSMELNQDNYFVARNATGSTIAKGTPVYISGVQGSNRPEITPAQANTEATAVAVGITGESIPNNADGRVMFTGVMEGINTAAFAEGDVLYLSAVTPGAFQTTPPLHPNFVVRCATVLTSHVSTGKIVVFQFVIRRVGDGAVSDFFTIGDSLTDRAVLDIAGSNLTASRTFTFPDASGQLALAAPYIASVRAATIANINLAAPGATIDGVAMAVGDRFLAWQQTTASENGVYIWNGAATPATRAPDYNDWVEIPGRQVIAAEGTLNDQASFTNYSEYTGTVGTTAQIINAYVKRIGVGARIDLGNSWSAARANNANGPRGFALIDDNAVMRVWRFTAGGGSPGIEFIKGTADDPGDLANDWWDIVLDTAAGTGVRFAQRSTGVTDLKMFVSTGGVRVGTDIAATDTTVAFEVEATNAILLPVGTTAQRPTGVEGYLRYNSTLDKVESFENGAWRSHVSASAGSGSLELYRESFTGTPTISATGTNSQAFGDGASASLYGAFTDANGSFAAVGDAQTTVCVLRCTTTNTAATTEMFLDGAGATQRMVLPNDTTWTFDILVTARRTDVNDTGAGYRFVGVVDRNATAGSTALIGTVSKTVIAEDTAAYDCNVNVDTTNGALRIQVNGVGTHTIRWVARATLVEVTG